MGKLFYLMGKSSSGKDTIYEKLLSRKELHLKPFVTYTTRPAREGETDGVQYYFVTEEMLRRMEEEKQVIELRLYHTVQGVWYYFTADGTQVDMEHYDYLAVGTLESYSRVRAYYGQEQVVPLYLEVEDGQRLLRAISREQKQARPDYEEMCRRFLADQRDFCEENILQAGITKRFTNNADLQSCCDAVAGYILGEMTPVSVSSGQPVSISGGSFE